MSAAASHSGSAPADERTLTGLALLLQSNALRAALTPYTLEGPYGRLLDSVEPDQNFADVQCFETEALMGQAGVVAPVLTYLFHRLEERFDGRPTLLLLDEAWVFLDHPLFAARIREWLKVLRMVLAVIVGIGSNYFTQFTSAIAGQEPDIGQAMSLVLASLALFGLGIFGPSIASGLVAGAPQLGAGSVAGTAIGAAGVTMLGAGAVRAAGGAALGAVRAGTAMGAAGSTGYRLGQEATGTSSVAAGLGGMARAGGNAARAGMSNAFGLSEAASSGRAAGAAAFAGGGNAPPAEAGAGGAPAWAQALKAQQTARHHRQVALQTLKEGDRGGASATPDIKEREDR